jgi:signal transduction histidine kinase/DNA-binding response OmpR family regulator
MVIISAQVYGSQDDWINLKYEEINGAASTGIQNLDSLIKKDATIKNVKWYSIKLPSGLHENQSSAIDLGYTDIAEIYTIGTSLQYIGMIGYFTTKKKWPENNTSTSSSPTQFVINDNVKTVVVKFKKVSPWASFHPKITTQENWKEQRTSFLLERNLTQGLFYGALIIMLLFNLFIFIIYRDRAYLFYSLYILSLCLALLPPFELAYSTFLAYKPYLLKHLEMTGDFGFIIFYFFFITSFLNISKRFPKIFQLIKYYLVLIIGSYLIAQIYFLLTKLYWPTQYVYQFNSVLSIPIIILIFVKIAREKDILSRFIITGTLLAMLGSGWVLIGVMFKGNFPYLDHYLMEAGHLAELLMFSIGLGVRFKIIEQERTRLKEMGEFKSKFFANITHEFRTPLTLIISPLEDSLKNGKKLTTDVLKLVLKNARKLLTLINQLLDLSKLDSGKMTLHLKKLDIMKYVSSYAMTFKSLTDVKDIRLGVKCEPESLDFNVDDEKLNKILNNLLFNAIKFTKKKGSITVNVSDKGNYLLIQISDTGIGIAQDKLPFVFNRYFQSDAQTSHLIEGTGIGLSLCKELVELHKGSISIESKEKMGTTVEVKLPKLRNTHPVSLTDDETINQTEHTILEESVTEPNPIRSYDAMKIDENEKIILIVEDNTQVREFVKSIIDNQYTVLEANNGNNGIRLANKFIPDIIISDLMMPEMDGITMTGLLKSTLETSHIPVIMLTARGETEDKIRGLEKGADAYLVKPFNADELKAQINNLLKQREQLRTLFSRKPKAKREQTELPLPIQKFINLTDSIIEKNLSDENFDVEKLSELLKINRSSLFRKLKSITGHTPSYYIRIYRLNKAAELLKTENLDISEIAFKAGFGNVPYFNKSFKEYFKITPSEYILKSSPGK